MARFYPMGGGGGSSSSGQNELIKSGILIDGTMFGSIVQDLITSVLSPDADMTTITCTVEYSNNPPAANTITKDVSLKHDGSVIVWASDNKTTNTYHVYYHNPYGDTIYFNPNCSGMFSGITELTSIDLSHIDSAFVTYIEKMFSGCTGIVSTNISTLSTESVVDMESMFDGCAKLTTVTYGDKFVFGDALKELMMAANATNPTYHMYNGCPANKPEGWIGGEWTSDGTYAKATTLSTGAAINAVIDATATSFNRSITPPPLSTSTTDISKDGDGSVVTWYDSLTKIQYWYSEYGTVYLNENASNMFAGKSNLVSIDVSSINVSKTTNMGYLFEGCGNLSSLNISGWNTSSVQYMNQMFQNCKKLTELDLSTFDVSKVTNFDSIFENCIGLVTLNISGWNTSSAINMYDMFAYCQKVTAIDVSGFDTSNVINMGYMFANCRKITSIDVSKFNTSNVLQMNSMFSWCASLGSLDLSNFVTTKVSRFEYMFSNIGYDVLESDPNASISIYYGNGFTLSDGPWAKCINDIEGANPLFCMFKQVNQEHPQPNKPSNGNWINGEWTDNGTLVIPTTLTTGATINRAINTNATLFTRSATPPSDGTTVTDISESKDKSVVTWYDSATTTQYWYSKYEIIYLNKNSSNMFKFDGNLTSIDLSSFNTSKTTDMSYMFYWCTSLTSLDLRNFDTSKVTNLSRMCFNCSSLVSADLSSFNTSKVTDMELMFETCSALQSLTFSSNFKTNNVISFAGMFGGCSSLTALDVSSFDTSKATNITGMFADCEKLMTLDLRGFNTCNADSMYHIFYGCKSLTSLDLTSFDSTNVTDFEGTFSGGLTANIIYGSNFTLSDDLYDQCTADEEGYPTWQMYNGSTSNKPTGGNWDLGSWTTNGTFIKNA